MFKSLIKKENVINFTSFLLPKFISIVLYAFSVSFYINKIGAETFGLVSYMIILFGYFQMFDLGLNHVIQFRLTKAIKRQLDSEKILNLIKTANIFFYFIVLLLILISVLAKDTISFIIFNDNIDNLVFYSFITILSFIFIDSILVTIIRSFNKLYIVNGTQFFLDIWRAIALIISAYWHLDLSILIVLLTIGQLLKWILNFFFVYKLLGKFAFYKIRFNYNDLIINIRFGLPMAFALISYTLFCFIERNIVIHNFGKLEVAHYNVASDINTKAWVLISAFTSSILVPLTKGEVKMNWKIIFLVPALIFLFYYLPLILFTKQIIRFWINENFMINSFQVIQILSISSFLYMISAVLFIEIQSKGKFWDIGKSYFISLIICLTFFYTIELTLIKVAFINLLFFLIIFLLLYTSSLKRKLDA